MFNRIDAGKESVENAVPRSAKGFKCIICAEGRQKVNRNDKRKVKAAVNREIALCNHHATFFAILRIVKKTFYCASTSWDGKKVIQIRQRVIF